MTTHARSRLFSSSLAASIVVLASTATAADRTDAINPNIGNAQYGGLAEDYGIPGYGDPVCSCSEYHIGTYVVTRYDYENGVMAGSIGLVLGGRTLEEDGDAELLVGWTEFQGGHDGLGLQDCPEVMTDAEDVQQACTYVLCDEVVALPLIQCACDQEVLVGNRIITNHTLTGGPGAGAVGTVLAGLNLGQGEGLLLVEFDSWDGGHDGNGYTDQTCPKINAGGSSRWYISCSEYYPITLQSPPSCPADIDQNGIVDGADLQVLLGNWGTCP